MVWIAASVVDDSKPVLHVYRDEDGSWFMTEGTTPDLADLTISDIREVLALDPTLKECLNLPPSWHAIREFPGGKWERENDVT